MTLRRTWKRYRPLVPVLAICLVGVALLPGGRRAPVTADALSPAPIAAPAGPGTADPSKAPVLLPREAELAMLPKAPAETAAKPAPSPAIRAAAVAIVPPVAETASAAADNAAATDARPGHIGAVAVNVHSGPSNAAETLFVAGAGEPVGIKATERGWVQIVTPDGGVGWVYGRFLAEGV